MKVIKFKPLRYIKKSNTIVVASYMQWRKIKTADYNSFRLVINTDYNNMINSEFVYNHIGENLFWRNYNPNDICLLNKYALIDGEEPPYPELWKTDYDMYCVKGLDVDGVPTFSHGTIDEIFNSKSKMDDFEPLKVETVKFWFGWFLYNLDNAEIVFD